MVRIGKKKLSISAMTVKRTHNDSPRTAGIASDQRQCSESGIPGPAIEEIAQLAYAYWEARNGSGGSAEDDWFRAERELTSPISGHPGPQLERLGGRSNSGARQHRRESKSRAVTS